MFRTLLQRRLVVVTGKGGVGKTSVAAAVALRAAQLGKRVLCCEVAATARLAPLFGVEGTLEQPLEVRPGLHLLCIRPRPAMREYALMKLKFQTVYRAVFENRLVRAFLRMIPSLAETVMLGKVWFEVQAKEKGGFRWDLVILDAPATGHGVSFLRVPQTLLETLPPGTMREDAEKMHRTLTDPQTTELLVVTLPEETPVQESLELVSALRDDLGMSVGSLVLNRTVASRFSETERAGFAAITAPSSQASPLDPASAVAMACLAQAHRAERSDRLLARLEAALPGIPLACLPDLPVEYWDLEAILHLSDALPTDPNTDAPQAPSGPAPAPAPAHSTQRERS